MLSLGLPMIVVWVFGTIIFAFWFLLKYRKHLEEIYVKRYFLILYQGLRPEIFYWEFVNTGRKVFIIICNVILANYNPMYRVLMSVLIILIVFRVQIYLKPYKDLINNEIEMKAIMVGSFTLYWGIVFVSNSANMAQVNIILLILLITSNAYFIAEWLLYLAISQNSKNKYLNVYIFLLSTVLWKAKLVKSKNIENIENILSWNKVQKVENKKKNNSKWK